MGQTGRSFKERINEHRRDVGKPEPRSHFALHLNEAGHTGDFKNFKILHTLSKGKTLDRLETIEIKNSLKNNVNLCNDVTFLTPSPLLDLPSHYPFPS